MLSRGVEASQRGGAGGALSFAWASVQECHPSRMGLRGLQPDRVHDRGELAVVRLALVDPAVDGEVQEDLAAVVGDRLRSGVYCRV